MKHWKIRNCIPDEVRERIVDLALDAPELSPWELATRFTDKESYFVSEASVYRLLKAHDQPRLRGMNAADEFKDKTTAPNQLWQTDRTFEAGALAALARGFWKPQRSQANDMVSLPISHSDFDHPLRILV
jgi:hypothetical protein